MTDTPLPILILADSEDEVTAVRDALDAEGRSVPGAVGDEETVRRFEERMPALLVVSFPELPGSEQACLTLYRQCPLARETHHQILVLCKQQEARTAYELCVRGTFDDYVINRPLYDPFRLRLSVRQALARQAAIRDRGEAQSRLAGVQTRLDEYDEDLRKRLQDGTRYSRETLAHAEKLSAHLAAKLEAFQQRLLDPAQGGTVRVLDERGYRRQFDRFRRDVIEAEAQRFSRHLTRQAEWVAELEDIHRSQIDAVRIAAAGSKKAHILVVDDDALYVDVISSVLQDAGYEVTTAQSGEAALEALRDAPPQLVILDINLPGLSGIETLRRLREDFGRSEMPVIMLSGHSEREVVLESIEAGADDYIVKPGDAATIQAKIEKHLSFLPRAEPRGSDDEHPEHAD